MAENRDGHVVTFYSYKGGTGRSMALANIAWILAANGNRVLVADWDLESPGLHRFFRPFLDADVLINQAGVIDMIRQHESAATAALDRPDGWHGEHASVERSVIPIDWQFPDGGCLDFLAAGRQNADYATTVGALDWDTFYDRLHGAAFLDALRADMKRRYDYALIDSRTGLSDVADICTLHLPDVLVDCFTLSDQGIDGAALVAHQARTRHTRLGRHPRILPVPMRVDQAEKEKSDAGRAVAMRRFTDLPTGLVGEERRRYWSEVEVPYQPYYAYEETLAVFGDPPGSRTSLLAAYEMLASYITNGQVSKLPTMDEAARLREKSRFERRSPDLVEEAVVLRYAPEDQIWAEWLEGLLVSLDATVIDPWSGGDVKDDGAAPHRTLTIVSPAYLAVDADTMPPIEPPGWREPVAVYVADVRPLAEFPADASISVANQSATTAAERVLRLFGQSRGAAGAVDHPIFTPRFPGAEPSVFGAPARNARFTGREEELRRLRDQLRSGGQAALPQRRVGPTALPTTLHGMGGVGKTQLALEYLHRFRAAYDIVWWIQADPPQFVDAALVDLALQMGLPHQPTAADTARVVLETLRGADPPRRWLIVYDNAEDLNKVSAFIPQAGTNGHVIITSRNVAWSEQTHPLPVDVFRRDESVAHLHQRVTTITVEEANDIADALGDLPMAVAAAGAWLAETGSTPTEYLRQVEEHGARVTAVERTWDPSLARLSEQYPAAARLLQLCSVMAPEISLDLLTGDEMAAALGPFDPPVSERELRGAPIQQLNRLALIKLDLHARQVQVHRLLQAVVRERMSPEEVRATRHQVHLVLARARPSREVDDRDTWPQYRRLWPHLEISGAVECAAAAVRQLLIDFVRHRYLSGDLSAAEELANRVIARWRHMTYQDDDATETLPRQLLYLRHHLASILRRGGRFSAALELDSEVYEAQRDLLGVQHPHTLMTAGGLAADLRALGRYDQALPRDRATYQAWLEVLGEQSPRTLQAASDLAASHRAVGDFRSARTLDEHVYQHRRVVLGPEDPNTLLSAVHLGRDLRDAGEYARSVDLLRQVCRTYRYQYTPDDPGTVNAQTNLAVSLRCAGRSGEAAPLLDDSYRRLRGIFGPDNPDTQAARHSRAANLLAAGEVNDGSAELATVTTAYGDRLGPEHPHTLVGLTNLAVASRMAGEHRRAADQSTQAARQLLRALGERHPYTLAAAMNVAICGTGIGEWEAAWEQLKDLAGLMTETLGPGHPDTLCCKAHAAIVAATIDRRDPDPVLHPIVRQLADVIGDDHPAVASLAGGRPVPRLLDAHPF
jgi:MinD-like ATPase involved in chromosome partitioning or flagellar assembly